MAYEYESTEARTLKAIQSKNYPDTNKDFVKNISRLNSSVDYISSYMGVMQKGIDDANQNIIEQIQGFFQDIWVLFAGGEPTGFDIGDLKYVFMALGALFGFSGRPFPYNVFDMVEHMFSNFLAFIPQFTDVIFDTIFAWADELGVDPNFTGILRDAYDNAIEALGRATNIIEAFAGVGGGIHEMLNGIGGYIYTEFIQPLINFISSAIGGPIGMAINWVQVVISRIFGLASGADAKASLILRQASPLSDSIDGNGEVSLALAIADTFMTINATNSRGAFIRCRGGDVKETLSMLVKKNGTIDSFHIDVYLMNATNGIDKVYTTPDIKAELATVETILFYEFPEGQSFTTVINGNYLVIARMTGSGSIDIQGRVWPEATTAMRPLYPGVLRNPTTTPSPTNIAAAALDPLYNKEVPYFQLGSVVDIVPQSFYVDFTTLSPNFWIHYTRFVFGLGGIRALEVANGVLFHPGGFADGDATIVYKYRCATERIRSGFRFTENYTPGRQPADLHMFCALDMSSHVALTISYNEIGIYWRQGYGVAPTEQRTTPFVPPGGGPIIRAGDWLWLEYDPDDHGWRVYRNPDWNDPDVRDPAHGMMLFETTGWSSPPRTANFRSGGISMYQSPGGNTPPPIDDWILEDWKLDA